jgi:CheY-like chemotaxis protein
MNVVRSIVLVDDDRDDQEIFKSACCVVNRSAQVFGFENGEQALKDLPGLPTLPDVIFLDLNMPRLNGMEVLQELKHSPRLKSVPVVIYSTSFDSRTKDKCSSLGAVEIIEKPDCFNTLCSKIEMVLQAVS